jgi:hypothetical protein
MKAMDCVKEEECPDALVEVIAAAAEFFKRSTFLEKFVDREALAQGIQ